MMGVGPRSPSASPAPWWAPQPAAPGPAERPRPEEPADPEPQEPGLGEPAGAPASPTALTSVVVLAPGCALQLPLDHIDLLLEPAPTSVLQVSVQDRTFVLIPEGLAGSAGLGQGDSPDLLELAAFLGPPGEEVLLEASVQEIGGEEEAYAEDEDDDDPESQTPWMDPPAAGLFPSVPEPCPLGPVSSPERCSPGPVLDLDFHLLEPFPNSPLQPQPAHPERAPGPLCKARRRLFQE